MQQGAPAIEQTLFERCWWLYALCREHVFTDHTDEIVTALEPLLRGCPSRHLLEVGCGPGFYARRLATLFPQLQTTGIDLSEPLLSQARKQARRSRLSNCRFMRADALSAADYPEQVDAVIASRLFLILADPELAIQTIYQALRPGGLCFVAEPRSRLLAGLPLWLMQRVAHAPLSPVRCRVLSAVQFDQLFAAQPWHSIRTWSDRGYLYAVCEKVA